MQVLADARGSVVMNEVAVEAPGLGGLLDQGSAGQLSLTRGAGNTGW